jgi:hypothetical protein
MRNNFGQLCAAVCSLILCGSAAAAGVPEVLPDPDGKPGDPTKPVQVYLLTGQSNMVGMGTLSGAQSRYDGVYLTADPAAPLGRFPIFLAGEHKIAPLGLYVGPEPDAARGGTVGGKPVPLGITSAELEIPAGADSVTVTAYLEVPVTGDYTVHPGYSDTTYSCAYVNGKPAYLKELGDEHATHEVVHLEAGKRHKLAVRFYKGGSAALWLRQENLSGNGDLEAVTKRDGKFPWIIDDEGNWTVRNDVYHKDARLKFQGGPLSPTSNGNTFGPELGFGHVLGTYHDEQVLIIKTAQGNRALGFDFRPPSSGRTDPDNKFESLEYQLTVEGVRKVLDDIENIVPGYQGQGYEMAGLVWWQGHKDKGISKEEYEKHLVNLINDLRKEFKTPKLPVVVATVGFNGYDLIPEYTEILKAQAAVGDPAQHPEYKGQVATVDTRPFWREVDDSPKGEDYHYNRNAETYLAVGDALGRAMVDLLEGKEVKVVKADDGAEFKTPAVAANEPGAEQIAARQQALRPILLDGVAAAYIADAKNNPALLREAAQEPPARSNQFLRGATEGLVSIYNAAGIEEYDWHVFGPDLRTAEWRYFSFDPPEAKPLDEGKRYRKVTYPAGMDDWTSPEFDPTGAGWKTGAAPFGQLDGKLAPLRDCNQDICGCGTTPKTLWDKEVLLIRGTYDFPPLKEGHRYRIVVGGSAHVNSGEGYAIYVNGKQVAESTTGVPNRNGAKPRGGHIYVDMRDEFKGGPVTIAATSFLQYSHPRHGRIPPSGHLTVWVEEQEIPPVE